MRTTAAAVISLLFVLNAQAQEGREPMVAFHCNQPAMYLTDNGWVKDDSTGCLKDPTDILSYCRKVFPSLDVRNVVEAGEKVTIPNWCDFGHTMCNQQFLVLPFRCLVGPFQSDALLVPEHCIFDHIHDSKICTSYGEWNKTSFRSCHDRDMIQQSFAMLQPCGIDKFSGVEFVCCPSGGDVGEKQVAITTYTKRPSAVSTVLPTRSEKSKNAKNNDFNEYVNQPAAAGRKWNEHEYYVKAKNDMRKHHHDKVAKMMKDWASARQRVQDLKAVDPKASEKLNKEITSRFQKTYEAEEVESDLEKKQLATLHQQRVQAELNDKKQHAFDNFMETIDDYDTDSTEILKALKHYIKALQKDRIHTVNRFKHLLETDPAEADTSRLQMAEHLRGIDQQLNQALDMLDRVPKYKNKVKKQIEDYLDSYHSIDASISVLLLNPERSTTSAATASYTAAAKSKVEEDVSEDDYENEDGYENEAVEAKDEPDTLQETEDATRKLDEEDYQEEEYEEVDEEDNSDAEDESDDKKKSSIAEPSASAAPLTSSTTSTSFPEELEADEDDLDEQIHVKHDDHIANMDKSYLHLKEPYIQKAPVKAVSSFNAAVPLGIAVGGITVFVVIIVGVVVMRRRARQRRPRSLGSLDLDPAASPEERHVASMQMNGYENPTYKYFEMNSNA